MTKELPKAENFRMTLNGQPVFFVNKIELTTGDDGCTKEKESEPWPTSFSLTATMECDSMSKGIRKLMGLYRQNRGKGLTTKQYVYRYRYYAWRAGHCDSMKQKRTLDDVRKYNPGSLPF